MRQPHVITERAWRLLAKIAVANEQKLEGENSDRNDDGTYTIELDDDFYDRLKRYNMRPGESLSDAIVRHLGWMEGKAS